MLITNMTIFFQIPVQKYTNNVFLFPNLGIFQLDKFKDADFKYDNSFFKISVQKYQIRQFWCSNLWISIFEPNFATGQIRRFQI